jgi:hypothetical protein
MLLNYVTLLDRLFVSFLGLAHVLEIKFQLLCYSLFFCVTLCTSYFLKKKRKNERKVDLNRVMLISSSFSKTFSAVYRPSSARLEWNFTFFAALCTGCFMHLAVLSIRQVSLHLQLLEKN